MWGALLAAGVTTLICLAVLGVKGWSDNRIYHVYEGEIANLKMSESHSKDSTSYIYDLDIVNDVRGTPTHFRLDQDEKEPWHNDDHIRVETQGGAVEAIRVNGVDY